MVHDSNLAREYWEAVFEHFPAWDLVREGHMPASEVREGYIHSHGIALQALGKAGNALLTSGVKNWKSRLKALEKIDWSRKNSQLWEGRAMNLGVVQKKNANIALTTNVIKQAYGLELSDDEQILETSYQESRT